MNTSKHRVATKTSDIYFENGILKLGGDISYYPINFSSSLLAKEYSLCQACQNFLLDSILFFLDDNMNKLQVGISSCKEVKNFKGRSCVALMACLCSYFS